MSQMGLRPPKGVAREFQTTMQSLRRWGRFQEATSQVTREKMQKLGKRPSGVNINQDFNLAFLDAVDAQQSVIQLGLCFKFLPALRSFKPAENHNPAQSTTTQGAQEIVNVTGASDSLCASILTSVALHDPGQTHLAFDWDGVIDSAQK
ncbi:hypothetical protein H4Q26_008763 [Puccinia striiformis f. sp. tritici PST-130]|nr:hypothetical protein H4Q26_008763 [Puccinia striiformis f. sp. tritici PST-130]